MTAGGPMFNLPPTEILFFLWCDEKVTFDLPAGIVSPDPATYTIEWLGDDNFSHTCRGSDPSDRNSQTQSLETTMDFVRRNSKYFNDPLRIESYRKPSDSGTA